MPLGLGKDKGLPEIPVAPSPSSSLVELKFSSNLPLPWSSGVAASAIRSKPLPGIKVEDTLSVEEMERLHELWNEAGLAARAYRRRHRGRNTTRCAPAPIAILDPQDMATTASVNPKASGVPRTEVARKRWGFLSAKPSTTTQEVEKTRDALKVLHAKVQDRLKRKIRCTKSTSHLSERVTRPSVAPTRAVGVPEDSGSSMWPSSSKSASPETAIEDADANAIYFTLDPDSRFSQESVRFQPITPIPESITAFGRPDSPLLHRHHSLDQLSFAAVQQMTEPSTVELSLEYPGDEIFRLIDEMQTYLEP